MEDVPVTTYSESNCLCSQSMGLWTLWLEKWQLQDWLKGTAASTRLRSTTKSGVQQSWRWSVSECRSFVWRHINFLSSLSALMLCLFICFPLSSCPQTQLHRNMSRIIFRVLLHMWSWRQRRWTDHHHVGIQYGDVDPNWGVIHQTGMNWIIF